MTKCGICKYKIEGDVYLVKIITEFQKGKAECPDCHRIHNVNKNARKIRVCGICHYDYEQKADHMGYVENEFEDSMQGLPYLSITENQSGVATIHDTSEKLRKKPYTIKILGKEIRKRSK